MLAHIVICCVSFFIFAVRTDECCKEWKHHKNFHLIHSGGDCGQVKINTEIRPRILHGVTARDGSLPWMAFILTKSVGGSFYSCTGTVINENYILTAAHCVIDKDISTIVSLGISDIKKENFHLAKIYSVIKFITHPEYNNNTLTSDIALLRLNESISFESPYINYICLPTSCELSENRFLRENLTIAGWGRTSKEPGNTDLQKAVFSVRECEGYYYNDVFNLPLRSHLCVVDDTVNACPGDSGGPLLYDTSERTVQVGVLSGGVGNCSPNPHGAYVVSYRVSSFIGWILDSIEP